MYPMNYLAFKPIYECLMHDARLDIRFMNSYDNLNFCKEVDIARKKFIDERWVRVFSWDLYFATDFLCPKLGEETKKIFLSHGISEKKYGSEEPSFLKGQLSSFDRVFVSSKAQYTRLRSLLKREEAAKVQYVGYPRLAYLTTNNYDVTCIRKELGLDNNLPIIVFAPTWGEEGSWKKFGKEIVETLVSLNVNVLLKLHDGSYYARSFDKKHRFKKHLNEFEKYCTVRIIRESDIYPYLILSDMLISDYGSLILEYQVLKKPTIFFDLDKHNELVVSNPIKLELLRKTCICIKSPQELGSALSRAKNTFNTHNAYRDELIKEYIDNAGTAQKQIIETIYKLLNLGNMEDTLFNQEKLG